MTPGPSPVCRSIFLGPHNVFEKNSSVSCPHLKIRRVPLKKTGFPFSNNNNKSKHFCVTYYMPDPLLNGVSALSSDSRSSAVVQVIYYYPHSTDGETEADREQVCSWLCPRSCEEAMGWSWWWPCTPGWARDLHSTQPCLAHCAQVQYLPGSGEGHQTSYPFELGEARMRGQEQSCCSLVALPTPDIPSAPPRYCLHPGPPWAGHAPHPSALCEHL